MVKHWHHHIGKVMTRPSIMYNHHDYDRISFTGGGGAPIDYNTVLDTFLTSGLGTFSCHGPQQCDVCIGSGSYVTAYMAPPGQFHQTPYRLR